jgi:hypothetical protein
LLKVCNMNYNTFLMRFLIVMNFIQWKEKNICHRFNMPCIYKTIPWIRIRFSRWWVQAIEWKNLVYSKDIHVKSYQLEGPKMNNCFTMLAYHCAFGPKDERLKSHLNQLYTLRSCGNSNIQKMKPRHKTWCQCGFK